MRALLSRPSGLIALALGALSVLLSACSGEGSASPRLFPLNEGWEWKYVMTTTTREGTRRETYSVRNDGEYSMVDGPTSWRRSDSLGNRYYLKADDTGIYRIAQRHELETAARLDAEEEKRFVLQFPLQQGAIWNVTTHAYFIRQGMNGSDANFRRGRPVNMSFTVENTDAEVTVPAGTFKGCTEISGRLLMRLMTDPVLGFTEVPISQREWYCPGTGLVKLERDESIVSKYHTGGKQSFELLSVSR